jgi:Uma2 family endonuclease
MSAIAAKTSYTPEDLLAMPDEKNYELVGGQLVERKMGSYSSWVGGELLFLLRLFCQANPIGWVFPADNGFQCFPRMPGKVLKPDVSFVRLDRLAGVAPLRGYLRIPPDLANRREGCRLSQGRSAPGLGGPPRGSCRDGPSRPRTRELVA